MNPATATAATTVRVNGREYRVPRRPTLVLTVDGGAPAYLDDALARGLMPRLAEILAAGGAYRRGLAEMPSLTNPNNLSIVTGAPPAVHGVPGNYCRLPDGSELLLNDPGLLRAPSIHAVLREAGVPVLMVTAKDKLRRLLGNGGVPSVSVERAAGAALPEFGVADVERLVGEPAPGVYDPEASAYAMRIGLAVHRRAGAAAPRLLYVSLTDRVQHAAAPGDPLADRFHAGVDRLLGEYREAGFLIGITADHGMSAKHGPDGAPEVVYLADLLDAAGVVGHHVVLPITDPYVRHHGALGSFAWLHVPADQRALVRRTLAGVPGVEEVYERAESALVYGHPVDRIGDLSVAAAAGTALGGRRGEHDLSGLHGALRSHGGRHEQVVPLIVSEPVTGPVADAFHAGLLHSRDLHALLLNGTGQEVA
ncbi:alkaline phosphatase family protein [Streptomyces hainanensis]|uniref:alkaline phosphatase family protein n=1 Tax=Streptomyces hainanensis TaxID=402648 RepID=UPI001A9CBF34|nr:alkaline phosphatase family protein [Streptomyces hainanensis]